MTYGTDERVEVGSTLVHKQILTKDESICPSVKSKQHRELLQKEDRKQNVVQNVLIKAEPVGVEDASYQFKTFRPNFPEPGPYESNHHPSQSRSSSVKDQT